MIVISNTTPLINFAAIGRIDILETLYEQLIIPTQVLDELSEKVDRFPLVAALSSKEFLRIVPIENKMLLQTLERDLDKGEAAALILAQELSAQLILMDEVAGRSMAKYYGFNITGSIGCLVEAKRRSIINHVQPLLDSMRIEGRFWISDRLYKMVLESVGEA